MSDIDEIKSRLNIVDVIGKHVKLKKAGRNFKGLCPFHGEKSPSFVVSPDRQIFHCFGCAKGGTVFDFVMEYQHVDFAEALEDLAAVAGVKLSRRASDTTQSGLKQKIYEANHLASEFYHFLLTKHAHGERGLQYLKQRGVSEKSMKTFMLGYSPNSWDGLYKFLRSKGYEDEILEKAGLIIRMDHPRAGSRGYYDRFRGRVMFTLKDHRGNVVGFAGRILDADAKEAKYINTSETPVYIKSNVLYGLDVTRDAISKANEAVVMEGELDLISSFQAGVSNAVAIKGSALTEGHIRLLKRYTERLTFALDSDLAGDAASRRGIELADAAGMDMRVVVLPSGKDPDEAARENEGLFKKAIKDAIPVYDYFLSSVQKRFDLTTSYGKKKVSEEMAPILSKIENPIVQNHYVNKTAELLGTSESAIEEAMRRMVRTGGARQYVPSDAPAIAEQSHSREERLEIYLLALLFQGKTIDLFEDLQEAGLLPEFGSPAAHRIMDKLVSFLSPPEGEPTGARVFLVKDFADSLPPELTPTFDEAFLWDLSEILDNEDLFSREWMKTVREFKKLTLHRKIQKLSRSGSAETLSQTEADDIQKQLHALTLALKDLEKPSSI